MNRYPRRSEDTVLFQDVLVGGTPQQNFQYALTQGLDQPGDDDWQTPINTTQGKALVLTEDMDWGFWKTWIRIQTADLRYIIVEGPRFLVS